jgi:3-oxoacyl-[acyl-carrier protein] reductase
LGDVVGSLSGKNALITGASSGIGKATARAFAREGVNLALLARNEDNLRKVSDEIGASGIRTLVIPADVSQKQQVEDAASRVREELGLIHVIVCCAGVYHRSPVTAIEIEDFTPFSLK